MKTNYQKLNASFFFIGIIACTVLQFINAKLLGVGFDDMKLIFAISLIAVVICFYRFNNGLIALIRGRFGKPKKNDVHFVDYDLIKNTDEIKAEIGESLLVYKLNSRDSYQIIKQSDRLLLRRIVLSNDPNECNYETDLSNPDNIKFARGDISIRYESIRKITYKLSPSNYYNSIIEILVGKKCYRYIGAIEELDLKAVKEFFDDVFKIKTNKEQEDRVAQKVKAEKKALVFKIVNLLACICVPNVFLSASATGKARILLSVYAMISVLCLLVYLILPIAKPTEFSFIDSQKTVSRLDNLKDVLLGLVLVSLVMFVSLVVRQTVLNTAWYIILIAVITIPISVLLIKRGRLLLGDNKTFEKIGIVFSVVCFVAIAGSGIVSGINYAVPVKEYTQTYSISDRWIETGSKGGDHHYVSVRFDGQDEAILVDEDTYYDSSNKIDLVRSRGILGIEYLTQE